MPRVFATWAVFFEALANQPARQRDEGFRWWLFDDRGVKLVPPVLMPEGEVPGGIPLSRREKQERAVLAALPGRKRARLLH